VQTPGLGWGLRRSMQGQGRALHGSSSADFVKCAGKSVGMANLTDLLTRLFWLGCGIQTIDGKRGVRAGRLGGSSYNNASTRKWWIVWLSTVAWEDALCVCACAFALFMTF
jgi:hypothetical protein